MSDDKYLKFMEAVTEMRRLQKDFYNCRSSLTLKAAKKAEKKVDEMILVEVGRTQKIQHSLFNTPQKP